MSATARETAAIALLDGVLLKCCLTYEDWHTYALFPSQCFARNDPCKPFAPVLATVLDENNEPVNGQPLAPS